jgi:hypothetical protein
MTDWLTDWHKLLPSYIQEHEKLINILNISQSQSYVTTDGSVGQSVLE